MRTKRNGDVALEKHPLDISCGSMLYFECKSEGKMSLTLDQWAKTMRYIRDVPGTVYEEQLQDILGIELDPSLSISDLLNNGFNDETHKRYLKKDPVTGSIYTIPGNRKELDSLLKDYFKNDEKPYAFNEYLYDDNLTADSVHEDFIDLSVEDSLSASGVVHIENGYLNVDFSRSAAIYYKNFDIKFVWETYKRKFPEIKALGYIYAENLFFAGNTSLSFDDLYDCPRFFVGISFKGSVFVGDFSMKNFIIQFESLPDLALQSLLYKKADFRNVRFAGKVSFKNIRFCGDTADAELSFEDARIKDNSEKPNYLEFISADFGHTILNFFQMTVGDFVDNHNDSTIKSFYGEEPGKNGILFKNISISDDSFINFSDAEIQNGLIEFNGFGSLPVTNLGFASVVSEKSVDGKMSCTYYSPNNRLIVENCEIRQTLMIGNVSQLSFKNTKNFGKIISAEWGRFDLLRLDKRFQTKSRGLMGLTTFGGLNIHNKLLLSVYNYHPKNESREVLFEANCHRARDFLILKENFASLGEYDDEDEAFILHMEFKPCLMAMRTDHRPSDKQEKSPDPKGKLSYRLMYRFLYDTGKYGISPLRVVSSLLVLIATFSLIYFLFSCFQTEAFCLGQTLTPYSPVMGDSNVVGGASFASFVSSFIYSVEGVIPFVSQFEPVSLGVTVFTAIENAIGSFLVGYFSVAVIRKTLR